MLYWGIISNVKDVQYYGSIPRVLSGIYSTVEGNHRHQSSLTACALLPNYVLIQDE